MKVTESYENRKKIEQLCKKNDACSSEYKKLISASNKEEFENVLFANFGWCVDHEILEEWLPNKLLNVTHLSCGNCTGLTKLPELLNVTHLYCRNCTGLQKLPELPELPNVTHLYCRNCIGLTELPELPNVTYLSCRNCIGLTK